MVLRFYIDYKEKMKNNYFYEFQKLGFKILDFANGDKC